MATKKDATQKLALGHAFQLAELGSLPKSLRTAADDVAPQWSRLLPGIKELSDAPPATAVASPLVGPKSDAEWRALCPTPAAPRTIDVIVERHRKARNSGASYQHSQFERDTKLPLKK
jgi:hypothetical protein